jgi:uncharacterized LabA/DUF88 family protein
LSKNVAVFVDVANLYYSARGQDVDVDYVALLKAAAKGRDLIRAYAYSGLDPENENQRKFIDFLGKNGYKVIHKDIRKFGDGRVKANLDIELVVDLFRLADRMDIAVVVSGDGDFAPAIRALQDQGVRCEVISFRPNTSGDLIAVADEFIDIMKIASIGRGKGEKADKGEKAEKAEKEKRTRGMSAPEMPAKEVVPEFGFREASAQVAAAALAALKSGGSAASRGDGRSRRATAAGEVTEARITEGGERRRRRRGGRGRGRGRRAAEATPSVAAERPIAGEGEIGAEELDDAAQLGEMAEEREYSFQEADEATLRELGLTPPAESAAEVSAKPTDTARSGGRGRRPASRGASKTGAGTTTAKSGQAKSRQPRSGTRTGAKTEESSGPAEKPTKSVRGTPRGRGGRQVSEPQQPEAAGEGEAEQPEAEQPEGIWQRFRSAR